MYRGEDMEVTKLHCSHACDPCHATELSCLRTQMEDHALKEVLVDTKEHEDVMVYWELDLTDDVAVVAKEEVEI